MSFPWSTAQAAALARLASSYNGGNYDASTNPYGFGLGGHVPNFFPALADFVTGAQAASDAATAAGTSATTAAASETNAALSAARLNGTSTTAVTIATGSKSFTTQAGKLFDPGQDLVISSDANPSVNRMNGTVTAYSGTALTVNVSNISGAGSFSDWSIRVTGRAGVNGGNGWSPVFAIATDSARRVLQVIDWTGGTGTRPTTGQYVGASGLTSVLSDAIDVRGASSVGSGNVNPTGTGFANGRFALFADATGNLIRDGGPMAAVATSGSFLDLSNTPTVQAYLDALSTTRGSVNYRGSGGWTSLTPGPAGQTLTSGGVGADPSWAGPSTHLDLLSATRGVVLYRGASGWAALAPGTSGQVLRTQGASADPVWASGTIVDRAYAEYTANANLTALIPSDGTTAQSTEGTQILTASLSPKSTTNRIRVRFQGSAAATVTAYVSAALFIGAATSAVRGRAIWQQTADGPLQIAFEYEYVPGTTSAQAFAVRVGPSAGTMRMNGGTSGVVIGAIEATTLTVEEIAA
jgi:hypothetical protein